jgi:branched-chain amino acid transport system ATP-binding protein
MDVVFAYATRVIVLARGRLIAAGDPASIRNDARVRDVYLGTGAAFTARAALEREALR